MTASARQNVSTLALMPTVSSPTVRTAGSGLSASIRTLYRDNARGKIIGDKEGVIKLVFEKPTRKLIGCHCIGDRASELVHIGQALITMGGTVETFIEMVFNYPTLAEMFKYAAYDALAHFGKA